MKMRRFKIDIPDAQIEDLKRPLRATRLPASIDTEGWDDGASLAFIRRLTGYWLNEFDWRTQEARLNRLPQYLPTVDGLDLHFVHQPGKGPLPYAAEQSTKPQTLAYAMTDWTVGLAAWIVEKFRAWSDCGGDVESGFTLDELLTEISIYWFGRMLGASFRIYKENWLQPLTFAPSERVAVPLGVAAFPHELPTPPRAWVERALNGQRWTQMPRGGHFAALEQPELLVEDIRAFFRPLR